MATMLPVMPGLRDGDRRRDVAAVVVVHGERDDNVGRGMERIGRAEIRVLHCGRAGRRRGGIARSREPT